MSIENHTLFNEIKEQLSADSLEELIGTLQDVNRGGANAGWCGFTYHKDTVQFYENNRKEIIKLLENDAEGQGVELIALVKSFNCLQDEEESNIAKCLYGFEDEDDDLTQVANALAWYALEDLARLTDI